MTCTTSAVSKSQNHYNKTLELELGHMICRAFIPISLRRCSSVDQKRNVLHRKPQPNKRTQASIPILQNLRNVRVGQQDFEVLYVSERLLP